MLGKVLVRTFSERAYFSALWSSPLRHKHRDGASITNVQDLSGLKTTMDVLFRDFQQAKSLMSGPKLAETICPVPPPHYLNRLEAIYHSSHPGSAARDIGYKLTKSYTAPIKLPSPEIDVWTEIYSAYYKACGEILTTHTDPGRADWGRVYELWKELSNVVIRGYTNNVLEAWTLPVLYMAGTNLRVFAIKADETAQKHGSGVDVDMGGMGDDIAGDGYGKNVKLEDAARVINRMFTICISDRYVAFNEGSSHTGSLTGCA